MKPKLLANIIKRITLFLPMLLTFSGLFLVISFLPTSAHGDMALFPDRGQSLGEINRVNGNKELDSFVPNVNPIMSVTAQTSNPAQTVSLASLGDELIFNDSNQSLGNAYTTGVAVGDLDNDGDLDAFVTNGVLSKANQVWLNQGTPGESEGIGDFIDSGQELGDSDSSGVALGDLDGDGDLDAFVANTSLLGTGGQPNKVWRNDGTGTFTNSQTLNLDDPLSASSAVELGDLDGDGDLDAFVTNGYISDRSPFVNEQPDRIWLNDGTGHFTSGQTLGDSISTALALGDVDRDGDLDALVMGGMFTFFPAANIEPHNQLWLNNGDGTFTESSQSLQIPLISRGVALGDLNGDGYLDAFVGGLIVCVENLCTEEERENQVWLNNKDGSFTDSDQRLGDSDSSAVSLADLDGDSDLDAFVANGYLRGDSVVTQANKIWLNDGTGSFTDTQSLGDSTSGAVALADLDGDGDLDSFVGNVGTNKVWRNDSGLFRDSEQSLGNSESRAMALGDLDGDGDLDAFIGNFLQANKVWLNNGHASGTFSDSGQSLGNFQARAVALGDLDGDHDLDAFVGNYNQPNKVWLNDGRGSFSDSGQSLGIENLVTRAVALGDLDGDGDLDAFVGNYDPTVNFTDPQPNQVWLNDGQGIFTDSGQSLGESASRAVALGDLDGDGDLDAFVANRGANKVWLNEGNGTFVATDQSLSDSISIGVALGDLDGDGDLDALVANPGVETDRVWFNDGTGHFTNSVQSLGNSPSWAVALGDLDGDGDLDAFIGNGKTGNGAPQPNTIWLNNGAGQFTNSVQKLGSSITRAVALADLNGDGNLDVFVANERENDNENDNGGANQVYLGKAGGSTRIQVALQKPGRTPDANFYSTPFILDDQTIPITYTLFDPNGATIGRVAAFYSMDGGDNWQPALPTTDTIVTNLAASPYPTATLTNTHFFTWDTFASGFFGQSDNVVFRLEAYPQSEPTDIPGSYRYTNRVPGPYHWPYAAATTSPFRVRGTQVRVYSETIGHEVANALVYRQPANQSRAELMANSRTGQPFRTNPEGFLRGRGQLKVGDQLVALLPITSTESYTLYHTSAVPTVTGLDAHTVSTSGVQELLVSADNPLILFDLDVSLEWDARKDSAFLTQLELDLQRTSRFLYDWTNGQVALGKVRVYHAKENWLDSHIIIPANNNRRPNADLGGIVSTPLSETLSISSGEPITISNAYLPGQVRMAAVWNRFGHPDDELGLDWPRTLAHELGHYLFFLPDNYLGTKNGQLTQVECQGSAMTDPYRDDYSEFLTRNNWTGACLQTLAHQYLGRADWETITKFYPMLSYHEKGMPNPGPNDLPLAVTEVTFMEPETPANTLDDPFFYITDENGVRLELLTGQAQGYLFKPQSTPEVTDDVVMAIGSPQAHQLQARGAELGDRLCVFDYSQTPRRLGCIEQITQGSTNLTLHEVPGWQPQITVDSVTSRTLAITVTQAISPDEPLHVQILPAAQPTTTISPARNAIMTRVGDSDTFTQTITLDYPIANGFVRLWVEEAPWREQMSEFFISGDWGFGASKHAWGPNRHRYGWGITRRHGSHAPVASNDGQVIIFDLDHLLAPDPTYTLQSLSTPPNLPPWLTPVGQAYRFSAAEPLTGTLSIMFSYLQREVPNDREDRLRIAYSSDGGQTWQLIAPEVDTYHNLASAPLLGEGIYILVSTIETPLLGPGWDDFAYLGLGATQPVADALASIAGYYTSVANYDPSRSNPWTFYYPSVEPEFYDLVNDLTRLEFEEPYYIHTTEAITLYVGTPLIPQASALNLNTEPALVLSPRRKEGSLPELPSAPATYYGWITPSASFAPTAGMSVSAWIDGNQCGQTTIQELHGQLAYKLQVRAENQSSPNGCGINERNIVFKVGNWLMENQQAWDNSRAWFHPLSTEADPTEPTFLYLPVILR